MKKWITLFLALLIVSSLSLTALAAENPLSLSDAAGQEGDIVYLAVSLNEPVLGNTIGISYAYDETLLSAQPDYSSWSIKGLMKDFDANNAGVWASSNTQELSGTICVLAFQLKQSLPSGTTVSCTMIVKNDATVSGTFTAEATISTNCDHQYSDWTDNGAIGHNRACSLCRASQTQSHTWDNGELSDNPENPFSQLKTFTCSVCSGTKTVEVFIQNEEEHFTEPTFPQQTLPTVPTTNPTDPPRPATPSYKDQNKQPTTATKPSGNSTTVNRNPENTAPTYRDYNDPSTPTNNNTDANFHVHSDGTVHYGTHDDSNSTSTVPTELEALEETHDHSHETQPLVSKESRQSNMILSLVVVGLMFTAGALYLKKKRK